MKTLTYKGQVNPSWLIISKSPLQLAPPIETNLKEVPLRPGAFLQSKRLKPRPLPFKVSILADSDADLKKKAEEVAAWLWSEKAETLVHSDEPDRTYYATWTDSSELDKLTALGEGVINFICPDPLKYAPAKTAIIDTNPFTIDVGGIYKTFPKIKATFKEAVTFFSAVTREEAVALGAPVDIDKYTAVQEYQTILNDSLSSTVGWTAGTAVDNGEITGTMLSRNGQFEVDDYGASVAKWHGPAIRKSLSEPLQDFRIEVAIRAHRLLASLIGRVEIYLLDEYSNPVGKIALKDSTAAVVKHIAEVRAGTEADGFFLISEKNLKRNTQLFNFDGTIRVERRGTRWTASVLGWGLSGSYDDKSLKYTEKVAQIQVHIGAHGTYGAGTQAAKDIKVWKINPKNVQTQVPYIAEVGDVIEIDHNTKTITKNGKPFNTARDPRGALWALLPGSNEIAIYPETAADVEITYEERFL
jgi:predicted phage tail component-like protein